jgi:hypothetical protein
MKVGIIFCLGILLVSCANNTSQNSEVLPVRPIVRTTSTPVETVSIPPSPTLDFPTWLPALEKAEIDPKSEIAKDAKAHGLTILEKQKFGENDLEIRVWRDYGIAFKKSIFVFKRANDNWSAFLIEKSQNKSPKRKKLKEPKSGWENVWRKFTEKEILTLPDGEDVNVRSYPDAWSYTIETKVGEDYRVYSYAEGYQEIREARQAAEIGKIIGEEFNIKNFETKKSQSVE